MQVDSIVTSNFLKQILDQKNFQRFYFFKIGIYSGNFLDNGGTADLLKASNCNGKSCFWSFFAAEGQKSNCNLLERKLKGHCKQSEVTKKTLER